MAESFNTVNGQIDDTLNSEADPAELPGTSQKKMQQPNSDVSPREVYVGGDVVPLSSQAESSDENFRWRAETTDLPKTGENQPDTNSCPGSHSAEISDDSKLPAQLFDVHSISGMPEQNCNESQPAGRSSGITVADASNAENPEASAMPNQTPDHQYSQASICSCFCTCEPYEEMNAMYETEESMPVCVQCEELSESECMPSDVMCSCDDNIVIVKPLYAVHCCTCGVQLSLGSESSNNAPEEESVVGSAEDVAILDDCVERVPAPPPPPSQSSYLFLGSRLARMPAVRRGPNSTVESRDSTAATPTLLLRALSCDDGSEFDSRLHEAARAGLAERLEALLQEDNLRACINSRARPLMATPLREAVVGGSDECVRLLLSAGAAVDAIDIKGQTALFMAASLGRPVIVDMLLRAGADPEGSRCNNCTPLLLTIREGCVASLQSLLRHGVDPEPLSVLTTCTPGWPLQYCVVFRRLDCFLELLKGGAQPSLAVVLSRGGQNITDVNEPILRRLSIVRSVLQHASDMPEFIRVYREFGGPFESISSLPDDLRLVTSPARQELQSVLDVPLSLTSLCRICLRRSAGAAQLPSLAAEFGLPAHLRAFLAFDDLDRYVAATNDNKQDFRES
ncbi:Ankyrin repeat-containing domain [Trinorchestia longiramus]|nr:Ankyrin repeat-containing domain [Trinorchestia longiramus]